MILANRSNNVPVCNTLGVHTILAVVLLRRPRTRRPHCSDAMWSWSSLQWGLGL